MTAPIEPIKSFTNTDEAWAWMQDEVDDPCKDNYRMAHEDDAIQMAEYQAAIEDGCCGSFDALVEIDGKRVWIGCNYGH